MLLGMSLSLFQSTLSAVVAIFSMSCLSRGNNTSDSGVPQQPAPKPPQSSDTGLCDSIDVQPRQYAVSNTKAAKARALYVSASEIEAVGVVPHIPGAVLPRGSEVRVLHLVPSLDVMRGAIGQPDDPPPEKACIYAAIEVVDAGQAAPPGEAFVVSAADLSHTPPGPSAQETLAQEKQAAQAELEEELRTGRCSTPHVEHFRNVVANMGRFFSDQTTVVGHKFAVAPSDGPAFEFTADLAGEYHFLALQYTPTVSLDILDAQNYPISVRSPFEGLVHQSFDLPTASLASRLNSGESVKVGVKGAGCTMVAVLRSISP